jgi:hypothetical protein
MATIRVRAHKVDYRRNAPFIKNQFTIAWDLTAGDREQIFFHVAMRPMFA